MKTSLKWSIEEASLLNTCHALMAFLSRDETKPFVWSFIVDSASLSRALSLLRRVDGIKRCSLVDGINRRRCRCTRRISPSSRRNQAESIADHSTTPRLSLSPRRHLVSLPLDGIKVIICSCVLLSCMSLIRLLLVLISCLICFVGLILFRGGSLRRRRSSLRWLSSDQKVKFLIHVFEQMMSEIVVLL